MLSVSDINKMSVAILRPPCSVEDSAKRPKKSQAEERDKWR